MMALGLSPCHGLFYSFFLLEPEMPPGLAEDPPGDRDLLPAACMTLHRDD